MASLIWSSLKGPGALLLLTALAPVLVQGDGVQLNLCASFNTAGTNRNTSIYQSNGLCSNFCQDDFAYAITQEDSCWCSNYTPDDSTEVDMDECDTSCLGYPVEKCGGQGLFGYVELSRHQPSGTKGGDSATTTATTSEESSTTLETTSTTTSSSDVSTSTDDSSPTSMVQTLTTDSGVVRTVTIMPSSSPDDNADENQNGSSDGGGGGGLGTGPVVGIVIGVLAAVGLAAGGLFFWFIKRRKRNQQDDYQNDPSVRGDSSDRNTPGLPEMTMGAAGTTGSGGSPGSHGGSNRNSTLAIDPRMDPFNQGLYARNGSHESINTIRDDHDYSRRILRATNPDPDAP